MCFRIYILCVQPDGMTFTIQQQTVKDSECYGHEQVQERIFAFVKARGYKLEEFRITLVEGRHDVHAKLLNELLPIKDEWPKFQIALNINGDKRYSVSGFMSLAELKARTKDLGRDDVISIAVGHYRMDEHSRITLVVDDGHREVLDEITELNLPSYTESIW